jgi:hypothetical protein
MMAITKETFERLREAVEMMRGAMLDRWSPTEFKETGAAQCDALKAEVAELERMAGMGSPSTDDELSYHDLHITTAKITRTSLMNLPFRVHVDCTRVAGWEVWALAQGDLGEGELPEELLGGEYGSPLRLDVAGHVIVDNPPEGGWGP